MKDFFEILLVTTLVVGVPFLFVIFLFWLMDINTTLGMIIGLAVFILIGALTVYFFSD